MAEVATGSLPCVVLSQARSRREDLQQVAGHLFFQDMSMFVPLLLLNVQEAWSLLRRLRREAHSGPVQAEVPRATCANMMQS